VRVRLRKPMLNCLVMLGMALAWTHVVLGRDALGSYGLAVVPLNALVLVILGGIAALLWGRRRFTSHEETGTHLVICALPPS
jgi:hypothetical protein